MAQDYTICLGTVGAGVWYSRDSGETWKRSRMKVPFEDQPGGIQIRALTVAPRWEAPRAFSGIALPMGQRYNTA